jgi:uncharacterized membrane protein YdjX (TVP38/TMEM64 family)
LSTQASRKLINISSLVSLLAIISLTIYWWQMGLFSSQTAMQSYVAHLQLLGPLIFIVIQIVQVVIPIIPGGISTAVGVVLFGPLWGFVYNYIGIVTGSFINFFLARYYGKSFILHVIPKKVYNRYIDRTKNQKAFDWFFAAAIFFPVAPDDVLVLMAGLTKMSWQKFSAIIIFLKPFTIAAYSFILLYGSQWLLQWFK